MDLNYTPAQQAFRAEVREWLHHGQELVASVQISSSDIVRVGDWVEMPQLNADGDVIDIALHTVKVQNWDKTITTILTALRV